METVQGHNFRSRRRIVAGALLTGLLVLSAVSATSAAADATVDIGEGNVSDINTWAFTPSEVTIAAGQSVTWKNSGTLAHTATATGGAFDTDLIAPGDSKTVVLSNPGTYAYICMPHPWMKGTITVLAATGDAAAQPTAAPAQPAAQPTAAPALTAAPAAAQSQPSPTPFRFLTPTPAVPRPAAATTTTVAPRAGGFPLELAAPLLAAGAGVLAGGAYILRRK